MQTVGNKRIGKERRIELAGGGWLTDDICPFYVKHGRSCKLAVGCGVVSEKKQQRCCSEDYDDCPTYLAFLLRRSRSLRSDSDWLDAV